MYESDELDDQIWASPEYIPYPVCLLELKDSGVYIEATYANGVWETNDGQVIQPSKIRWWQPLKIIGL